MEIVTDKIYDLPDIDKACRVHNDLTIRVNKVLHEFSKLTKKEVRLPYLFIPAYKCYVQLFDVSVFEGEGYEGCNLSLCGKTLYSEVNTYKQESFLFPLSWLYFSPELLKSTLEEAVRVYKDTEYTNYVNDQIASLEKKKELINKDIAALKRDLKKGT